MKKLLTFILLLGFILNAQSKENLVNPLDYGLRTAVTDIDRYNALLKCHQYARDNGFGVTYEGVDTIFIEIPSKFTSIPLTEYTDFCGATIIVTNHVKTGYLFYLINNLKPIQVEASMIDSADFYSVEALRNGMHLLVIKDESMWVDNRSGRDYGHQRKDIILVKDGIGLNKPIMPYDNEQSRPNCSCCVTTDSLKVIKNLHFVREQSSNKNTELFRINQQNNIMISNVTIKTYNGSKMTGDRCISVTNSTNVVFEDIKVDGTYSTKDVFGYAFNLENVWNHIGRRISGKAEWGLYGNYDINLTILEDCELNRYDIHCYGKDVFCKNCTFNGVTLAFSSIYGTMMFENCTYDKAVPLGIRQDYNAYTPFDVKWHNCTFNLASGKNFIVKVNGLSSDISKRPELAQKCLPNIEMKDCVINAPGNMSSINLFTVGKVDYPHKVGHISMVNIDGLKITGGKGINGINIFSKEIKTDVMIKKALTNISISKDKASNRRNWSHIIL